MANTLTEVIPQLLAQGLLALRENAIMPRLVNSDYDAMAAQKGASIDVPIPSAIAVQNVTPAATPPSTADVVPTSVNIPLDQWKEAPFYMTDKDLLEVMAGTIPMQASEAIKALANVVDGYIIALYKKVYGQAGSAGVTPFATTTEAATDSRTVLNKQLAPLPDRRFVLDPDAEGNALNLRAFQDISWAGDPSVIKEGIMNPKLGFVWHMDQNIQTHTSTPFVANVTVTGAEAIGSAAIGLTCDATGVVDCVIGDLVKFPGDDQSYVVTADLAIASSNVGDLLIDPPLKVALVGSEVPVLTATHVVNLAFHRDCFAFASRPLGDNTEGLGNIIQSAVDPISGLALRLEVSREHKRTRYSYDILYGGQCVRPQLGARLLG